MAPEQARGMKHVDGRTDLYAVGALLFESLTGQVPFTGENFNDLMFKIALAPRPNPMSLRADLDATLAKLVVKAIAADTKERFQTAGEFRAALVDWLASRGVASVVPPDMRHAVPPSWNAVLAGTSPGGVLLPVAATPFSGSATLGSRTAGAPPQRRALVAAASGVFGFVLLGVVFLAIVRTGSRAEAPPLLAQPLPLVPAPPARTPATTLAERPAPVVPEPAPTMSPDWLASPAPAPAPLLDVRPVHVEPAGHRVTPAPTSVRPVQTVHRAAPAASAAATASATSATPVASASEAAPASQTQAPSASVPPPPAPAPPSPPKASSAPADSVNTIDDD